MRNDGIRVAGGRKKKMIKATDEAKKIKQERAKEIAREAAKTKKKKDDLEQINKDPEALLAGSYALQKLVEDQAVKLAREITDNKVKAIQKKIGEAKRGRHTAGKREYEKFSCEQLINLFGGWFTLSYLFSVKNNDPEDTETDFYVCSQDVSMLRANERPEVNQVIKKQFGKTVYGFAIIAPSTAFE